jgi:hypothetical protein
MKQPLHPSGRKYSPVINELLAKKFCKVKCTHTDTTTIMEGVKKEKVRFVKKKLWPSDMALRIEVVDGGIEFKMVVDTSIRNL